MKKTILFLLLLMWPMFLGAAVPAKKIPVLVDTDIGTDIDDAFALALVARSPQLDLLGLTTVSGDTEARARLAAKLLWVAGLRNVPVVPGAPGRPLPDEQTRWADGFKSPELKPGNAVDFLDSTLRNYPEKVTLITIGPLTNIAALFTKDPSIKKKIDRIVMMGGSVYHGYGNDPNPVAEYNIASNPAAAQKVFTSGVPILMAPLDVTAMLQLDRADRHRVFTHLTPLTDALTILYNLWGRPTPTLFDPMAVSLVLDPSLCQIEPLHIQVDSNGMTHVVKGQPPNAEVALHTDPQKFFQFYLSRVAPQPKH